MSRDENERILRGNPYINLTKIRSIVIKKHKNIIIY